MQDLYIAKEKDTLGVECNVEEGLIKLEGTSYPENALVFFDVIFDWLEEYIAIIEKRLRLELRISYLNTSSSKCLLDFLEILEEYFKKNNQVEVIWFYNPNDISMFETGEEFKEDLVLPFKIISKN